jgi:hypothetical protein
LEDDEQINLDDIYPDISEELKSRDDDPKKN